MTFGIVMTVILLLSGLSLCLTGMGRMMPLGFKLMPFVEAALLWLYISPRGNKGWLGILFLVQFYLMFVFITVAAASGFIGEVLDRERNIGPVTLGNPRGEKTIVAIYHPGGSNFTGRVMREIGDRLAGTEYKMVLYSARRGRSWTYQPMCCLPSPWPSFSTSKGSLALSCPFSPPPPL